MKPMYPCESFRNLLRVPRELLERFHKDAMVRAPGKWWKRNYAVGKQDAKSEVKLLTCLRHIGTG